MPGWDSAVWIVKLPTTELGIDSRLLASVSVDGIVPIPPELRPLLIHQKRAEVFRDLCNTKKEQPEKNRFDTGDRF